MLSIGGQIFSGNMSNSNETAPDAWNNGLGIFDMSALTWGFNYNADAAAYVPFTQVTNYYNTSSRYPSFTNTDLAAIFSTTATSTSGPTHTGIPGLKPPHTGAIAGDLVGGVVFLALLAGLVFFFWWRNKRQRYSAANVGVPPESPKVAEMNNGLVPEMDEQRRVSELYTRANDRHAVAGNTVAESPVELG